MPATFSRESLGGSANFNMIRVDAASSPGITIHTAVSGTATNQCDEIWLWAVNSHTQALKLTIEWAQTNACIEQTIPPESGKSLIIPGESLRNGYVISAYGGNASQIFVSGYINQIRP